MKRRVTEGGKAEKEGEDEEKEKRHSKGPFTNDVSREGEGGGYPNSDAVREVA